MERKTATLFLLLSATFWSLGGVLIKTVPWMPLQIASIRSAIAACFLAFFCKRKNFVHSPVQWLAAVAYAATVVMFVVANKWTTAANAILLQYTAPIYVALFAHWFLGEPTSKIDWLAIGLALAGMSLFFLDQLSLGNVLGNILAILSGVSFAWLTLLLRKQKNSSTMESVFLGNLLAAVLVLPFAGIPLPGEGWFWILILGIFQLGLPYILYSKAIRHVNALDAMLIMFIEPILNPIWVLIFRGERPGVNALIGGGVILTAVLMRNLFRRRRI